MLPPTQDALLQHCKRVVYQSGIWCTRDQSLQHAPSPRWSTVLMVGAGLSMSRASHGSLCGTRYLWSVRPAVNWLNVAARAN